MIPNHIGSTIPAGESMFPDSGRERSGARPALGYLSSNPNFLTMR